MDGPADEVIDDVSDAPKGTRASARRCRLASMRAIVLAAGLLAAWVAGPALGPARAQEPVGMAPGPRSPDNPRRPPTSFGVDKRTVPMRSGDPQGPRQAGGGGEVDIDPVQRLQERLNERLKLRLVPGTPRNAPVVRVEGTAEGDVVLRAGTGASAARPPSKAAGGGAGAGAARAPRKAPLPAWSYEGADGPEVWGRLHPDYAICASGRRQSPIDIRDGIGVDQPEIQFDYRSGFFAVVNTGRGIEVRVAPGSGIEVGTRRYDLKSLQFHHPSEMLIEGRRPPMAIHLMHQDGKGRRAVVVLLGEIEPDDTEHPAVQKVWNHLPLEPGVPEPAPDELDLARLLPKDRGYHTFMGSLSTPPCTEGVVWMVLQAPLWVSREQLAILARLVPMNARPVQPTHDRLIKRSR